MQQLPATNAAVTPLRQAGRADRAHADPPVLTRLPALRANLGIAGKDLATAAPDLTIATGELNRFFNIGAYNPGGAQGLTGNTAQDQARQEGFLYWTAWTAQNGVSLQSSANAQGPWRRTTLCGLDVSLVSQIVGGALAQLVAQQPALLPTLPGIVNKISASGLGLC